jgi:hypothetical protein
MEALLFVETSAKTQRYNVRSQKILHFFDFLTVNMRAAGHIETSRIIQPVTVSLARRLESAIKIKFERFEFLTVVSLRIL